MKYLQKKIVIFGIVILFLTILTTLKKPADKVPLSNIDIALSEANEDFTYGGTYIHPYLIKEFETWISDNCPPITASVDIDAATKAKNKYDPTVVTLGNGQIKAESSDGYYMYEYIGRLKNGLHIVVASDGGTGSGIFKNLFFIKFIADEAYDPNGNVCPRLLMTVVGAFLLGDRDDGTIKVYDDKVIVSASKYRKEETVIEF